MVAEGRSPRHRKLKGEVVRSSGIVRYECRPAPVLVTSRTFEAQQKLGLDRRLRRFNNADVVGESTVTSA